MRRRKLLVIILSLILLTIIPLTSTVLANPTYVLGPGGIVASIDDYDKDGVDEIYYYISDGISTSKVINESRSVIYSEKHEPDLKIIGEEGDNPSTLIAGARYDKDTGLWNQIYDSTPGIYIRATGVFGGEILTGIGSHIATGVFSFIYLSLPHEGQDFLRPLAREVAEEQLKSAPIVNEINTLRGSGGLVAKGSAVSRLVGYTAGGAALGLKVTGYNPTLFGGKGCAGGGCAVTNPRRVFYVNERGVAIASYEGVPTPWAFYMDYRLRSLPIYPGYDPGKYVTVYRGVAVDAVTAEKLKGTGFLSNFWRKDMAEMYDPVNLRILAKYASELREELGGAVAKHVLPPGNPKSLFVSTSKKLSVAEFYARKFAKESGGTPYVYKIRLPVRHALNPYHPDFGYHPKPLDYERLVHQYIPSEYIVDYWQISP